MTDVDIVAIAAEAVEAVKPRAQQSGLEVTLMVPDAKDSGDRRSRATGSSHRQSDL